MNRTVKWRFTYIPELRTWYRTPRALFHFSVLLDARHSLRECIMRSIRSCFFPDLLSIVQHSSLKPEMICLSRSTVLSLTLTLRPYRITVKDERETRRGEEGPTSKSAQGSTADMTRANETKRNETKRRTANWAVALPRLSHTTPNTRDIASRPPCPLKTRTTTTS
jgi:hypothetical protein